MYGVSYVTYYRKYQHTFDVDGSGRDVEPFDSVHRRSEEAPKAETPALTPSVREGFRLQDSSPSPGVHRILGVRGVLPTRLQNWIPLFTDLCFPSLWWVIFGGSCTIFLHTLTYDIGKEIFSL